MLSLSVTLLFNYFAFLVLLFLEGDLLATECDLLYSLELLKLEVLPLSSIEKVDALVKFKPLRILGGTSKERESIFSQFSFIVTPVCLIVSTFLKRQRATYFLVL